MWPQTQTMLAVMAVGAMAAGFLLWQLSWPRTGFENSGTPHGTMQVNQHSGSMVIVKRNDGVYAPVLRHATERQLLSRRPCVIGVCQDI